MAFVYRGLGGTPLVRAAQEGYVQVVQALLKGGASVELQDSDGCGLSRKGCGELMSWVSMSDL